MKREQLKAAVAKARAGKQRGRFSAELKAFVVEYGRGRRRSGASWRQIGDEVGLAEHQVSNWCRGGKGAPKGRLRKLAVVDQAALGPGDSSLTLTLAGGAVVSGLDVGTLAQLLKALR